jgi:hypothetical protein
VFSESAVPAIDGCGVTRDISDQALERFVVTYLSAVESLARLNSASVDLLITPYGYYRQWIQCSLAR